MPRILLGRTIDEANYEYYYELFYYSEQYNQMLATQLPKHILDKDGPLECNYTKKECENFIEQFDLRNRYEFVLIINKGGSDSHGERTRRFES